MKMEYTVGKSSDEVTIKPKEKENLQEESLSEVFE